MSPTLSIAASLPANERQAIGIQVLARTEPISHLAAKHEVSRKFVYQQGDKAQRSLDKSFVPTPANDETLFHLPVTKNWGASSCQPNSPSNHTSRSLIQTS